MSDNYIPEGMSFVSNRDILSEKARAMQNPRMAGRIPPQAVEMEQAVLGALMLERGALEKVVGFLKSEMFYKESHKIIYEAMMALVAKKEPIDLLTLKNQLSTQGKLEHAGGLFYLMELTAKVASGANIEYHAKIIRDRWMKRELIKLGDSIVQAGYDETADTLEILDAAKRGVSGIDRFDTGKITHMPDLVEPVVSKAEKATKGEISYVRFGLDELREYAMAPGDIINIAGRPAMGKTAMAMAIAKNVASTGIPVLIDSLETEEEELTGNDLASSHSISGMRLRTGDRITGDILVRMMEYAPNYTNIYIVEMANTVALLVEKLRQLRKQLGVGQDQMVVIILDYIQLMKGEKSGTREQEVSGVSRELKEAAMNEKCVIIELCQLSRAVESRGGDKKPQLSDLRECLSVETSMIYSSNNFSHNQKHKMQLLSLSKNSMLKEHDSTYIEKDQNLVFRLKTGTGRFIDCTAEHPVLTSSGYKKLRDISPDDAIAIACGWDNGGGTYIPESRFIGWMIGNGSMTGYAVPSFITADVAVSNDFIGFVESRFGFTPKRHRHAAGDHIYSWDMTHSTVRTKEGNRVTHWLKDRDMWGRTAKDKYIPDWFMQTADIKSICELIQGLWETDGCVAVGKKVSLQYATTSSVLSHQILFLLARIGVVANVDNGYISKKATTPCFKVSINASEHQIKFAGQINLVGKKGEKLAFVKPSGQSNHRDKLGRDTTVEIHDHVEATIKGKVRVQIHGNRRLTKSNLASMIQKCPKALSKYKWLVSDNLFWDTVDSITELGVVPVFDRNVPGTHNFVVNGIVVHNSGSLEQDANMVIFLYRPEYYGLEVYEDGSSTKGIGEVIIAKCRGGVAGATKKLSFQHGRWGDLHQGGGVFNGDPMTRSLLDTPTIKPSTRLPYADDGDTIGNDLEEFNSRFGG